MFSTEKLSSLGTFIERLPERRRSIDPELYATLIDALETNNRDLVVSTLAKINSQADEAIKHQQSINSELKEKLLVIEEMVKSMVEPD